MFSHRLQDTTNEFMVLKTANGQSLSVTSGHYVWARQINGAGIDTSRLMRAADVKVGAGLWTISPNDKFLQPTTVIQISTRPEKGLHNPHTVSGSIIVNNIASATFTETLPASTAAHTLVTLPAQLLFLAMPTSNLADCVNSLLLAIYFNTIGLVGAAYQLASTTVMSS